MFFKNHLLLSLCIIFSAYAQVFEREPYLQRVSDSTVIVRFRTASSISTTINFSPDQNTVVSGLTEGTPTKDHRFQIENLTPNTKYFYQILNGGAQLTPNDGSYFFVTSPTPGTVKNTRLWVLGDSGRGNANAYNVKNGYLDYSRQTGLANLFLMLGDNAYNNGLDNEFTTGLFNVYPEVLRNTPLWPTLGNHDGYAKNLVSGEIPYYKSFSLPRNGEAGGIPSGTESYYSFDYANIHFVCLNSYDEIRSSNGAMANWLKQDLAASTATWKIAFWHHPPYSKGTHNSDTEIELIEMREQIIPLLEDGGIDLVLAGHSHNYERSFLLDGHYGPSNLLSSSMMMSTETQNYLKPQKNIAHAGAIYVVNGTGALANGGSLDHPIMINSQNTLGSMVIDINGFQLNAKMVNDSGQEVDNFIIDKKETESLAKAQSIPLGTKIGNLNYISNTDRLVQKLNIKRNRNKLFSVSTTYRFQVPKNFSNAKLILNAYKNKSNAPDYQVSYSVDGAKFKLLTTVVNYKNAGRKFYSIPRTLNNNYIYVKINSKKSRKQTTLGNLNLNELKIQNH